MTSDDLRRKNAHLRDRIEQVLEKHPELRDVNEEIALRQDLHVEVGTASSNEHKARCKNGRGQQSRVAPNSRAISTADGRRLADTESSQASDGGSAGSLSLL
jgi:hypothetical protein